VSLYLVEHFYSIQGEVRYVGSPSLYFRFGGCNMKCAGFACSEIASDGTSVIGCDTVYAVNKKHFSHNWANVESAATLISIFESYDLPSRKVDVVFTGGEPLLYIESSVLIEFMEYLVHNGHRITFETNGSINIDFEKYSIYKNAVFALSVKLSNSEEPYTKRIQPSVINNIAVNAKDAFFKFSIDEQSINIGLDEEIEEIISYSSTTEVFCMPLGGSKEDVEKNALPLIEYCKSNGFNYSDRLHIRIWDQNKGV
jgi:organic radical activating enzyme